MSSGEWKGEILLEEDAWPGLEEEEDVEIYNLTHQMPRKWSSSSLAGSGPNSPFRQTPKLSLPGQIGNSRDIERAEKRRASETSECDERRHQKATSSLYSELQLMLHIRPRSTSPRPRSPPSPKSKEHHEQDEVNPTKRGRSSSTHPVEKANNRFSQRKRAQSYHGEIRSAAEVPTGVLVEIAS